MPSPLQPKVEVPEFTADDRERLSSIAAYLGGSPIDRDGRDARYLRDLSKRLDEIRKQERQRVREALLGAKAVEKVARLQHGDFTCDGKHYSFDFLDDDQRELALAEARRTIEAALDSLENPNV